MNDRIDNLLEIYKNDIDIDIFPEALIQFKAIMFANSINNPADMLKFIVINKIISTFPNMEIILRMYLTLSITNA